MVSNLCQALYINDDTIRPNTAPGVAKRSNYTLLLYQWHGRGADQVIYALNGQNKFQFSFIA